MKSINITKEEFDYIVNATFISDEIKSIINKNITSEGKCLKISIAEDLAEEIRDKCGDQLQLVGFDKDYNPNEEGEILESLIDKLYTN